jgi:hypothetical protein
MTLVSRISVCGLAALMALPAAAQTTRRRAVSPTGQTGPTAQVVITVKDASNGVAAENAVVTYSTQTVNANANGQLAITLPAGKPSIISIVHPAFEPSTQTITAQTGGRYDVALTEKPSVTIKTKTNETHIVDIGTAQFAYNVTFSGYVRTDNGNFCKDDGTDFAPLKTEFTRIVGPATPVTAAACCTFGPIMSANVEMKSGAKLVVYFKDSCFGNEIDFVGREKDTGKYTYFRFTDINEIDFP